MARCEVITLLVCLTWTPGYFLKKSLVNDIVPFKTFSPVVWSILPSIKECGRSAEQLCLEVDFHDNGVKERAYLNGIDNGVYYGSFEQRTDVAIAATSEAATSSMQVKCAILFLILAV